MKKAARITIISLVVVFVVAGVVAWAATWTGSTKDIRAVADQFRPPASWQLVDEMIEPPRMLCLQDVACPELVRVWSVNEKLTLKSFSDLLHESGWEFKILGDCELTTDMTGSVSLCHSSGNVGKYHVYLDYATSSAGRSTPSFSINIREKD